MPICMLLLTFRYFQHAHFSQRHPHPMKTLHFTLQKEKAFIATFLTDPERFVSVHPLIYRMEPLGDGQFKVFEQVMLGPLPIRFTYKAEISEKQNAIFIRAVVMRLTNISMTFRFESSGNSTTVIEDVDISSPLPIRRFMEKLIAEQHQIMFQTIQSA